MFIWGEHSRGSLMLGTTRVSLHKHPPTPTPPNNSSMTKEPPKTAERREKRSFLSREHRAMQFLRSCDMLCSNSVDIMSTGNVEKRAKTTCVLKTRKNSGLHAPCHGEIRVKGVPLIYNRTVQC